jgi:hypothetical protein
MYLGAPQAFNEIGIKKKKKEKDVVKLPPFFIYNYFYFFLRETLSKAKLLRVPTSVR